MKKLLIALTILISIFTLSACNTDNDNDDIVIITTLFPQYDFTKQIAGDLVDVEFLLPPGTSAHAYEPSPATVVRILEADLLIYTGDAMEPWVDSLIKSSASDLNILDLSVNAFKLESEFTEEFNQLVDAIDHVIHEVEEGELTKEEGLTEIDTLTHAFLDHGSEDEHDHDHDHESDMDHFLEELDHALHEYKDGLITAEVAFDSIELLVHGLVDHDHDHDDDHDHGDFDPHIWLDPLNAKNMVTDIENALVELLPDHEETLRSNASSYRSDLDALHEAYLDLVANASSLVIMHGGHNAFSYFANRYGIEYVTPYVGFSSNSEPTPQALADMIDLMQARGITHLFSETLISPNVANAISEATQTPILYLSAAGNVSRDDFENGVTFLELMYQNLEQLKIGMGYNGSEA
jgi:zinc transport system substrate-binding protein